jgi:hypothetical protein
MAFSTAPDPTRTNRIADLIAATAVAAGAGAAAALAYLDAKLHLRKDLDIIRGSKHLQKIWSTACKLDQ